jgi:hypothetical protein
MLGHSGIDGFSEKRNKNSVSMKFEICFYISMWPNDFFWKSLEGTWSVIHGWSCTVVQLTSHNNRMPYFMLIARGRFPL